MERAAAIAEPWFKRLAPTYEQMTPKERMQQKVDLFNLDVGKRDEEDGYSCAICKNRGFSYVLTEYNGVYDYALSPCKCVDIRNQRLRLRKNGLLDAVKRCTFAAYQTPDKLQESIKDIAMRFCKDDEHRFFFIGGQSGAGKSHICTAIFGHYINEGKTGRYMVWFDEATRIKAIVNEPEEYEKVMSELKTSEVLYIDDLFKPIKGRDGQPVPPTYADVRLAIEIVNYRYNNPELITIISGERTINELLFIDEALAGRIFELSKAGGYCINLKQDSNRNWRLKDTITL